MMKGVILAGGSGSRLRPITHTGPKQLVPVANKPLIEYAIEDLRDADITEIAVVLGNKGREEIRELLGDGSAYGVEITYVVQGDPKGVAHAIGCAEEFIGEDDFVVYLGDNILKDGIEDHVARFDAGEYGAGIAVQHVDNPSQFGVVTFDEQGNVETLVEKPPDPPTDLALVGVYVFTPAVFDAIDGLEPSDRGELEVTDAIRGLLDRGHAIDVHEVTGWWKDTGRPEDILHANRLVLEDVRPERGGEIHPDAEIDGRVELSDTASLQNDVVVRGPVSIAEGVAIQSGTYVGPYTSIGPQSTLRNVHIENSVVIGDATISASGRIVDSLLGTGVTIESADQLLPDGRRLVVGEHSKLKL